MPVPRIGVLKRIPTHQRNTKRLFKDSTKSNDMPLRYNGFDLIKNSHVNFWNRLVFAITDRISSLFVKYPKLNEKMMNLSLKLLKSSNLK